MIDAAHTGRTIADLEEREFSALLGGNGLALRVGPFNCRLRVDCPPILNVLAGLYRNYPVLDSNAVFAFHPKLVTVRRFAPLRWRRVRFSVDGKVPHEDMPFEHALPTLEWGINLLVAMRAHWYLMLHAAVLEKNGFAVVLPGTPGSGKTTLAAALTAAGWRLFSDEFGLVRDDAALVPAPRPMVLKNRSIDVIAERLPDRYMGPKIAGTRKGTVAHFAPTADDVAAASRVANARWIVFPEWGEEFSLELEPLSPIEGFMGLSTNAFNYEVLGESAFLLLKAMIDSASSFQLRYSKLDDAIAALDDLAAEASSDG